jgi:hypothetical protein
MKILNIIKESFSAILKPGKVIFRIQSIYLDANNKQKIRYQSIGKASYAEEGVQELVNSLVHLQGFSDEDSCIILAASQQQKNVPPLLLESVTFNENGPILLVRDLDLNEQISMDIMTLYENLEIIGQFNNQDGKAIAMLLLNHLIQKENKIKATSIKEIGSNVIQIR